MEPVFIHPTVGRVVNFWPDGNYVPSGFVMPHDLQPCAAQISCVHSDDCVNLGVLDANGNHYSFTSVTLVQRGNPGPGHGSYCTWMDYQVGQAAKTQEMERQLAGIDAGRTPESQY